MKIAVVGSGISGLVCAHVLSDEHEVVVFEASDHIGGHTHTHTVDLPSGRVAVDSGFIVFNESTYPNFIGLLAHLGVESRVTSMSFSVRCERCRFEYSGASWRGLIAQKRNLLRPSYWRFLSHIPRFHEQCLRDAGHISDRETVSQYLDRHGFSSDIAEHYLLPMGAAIWSCPMKTFGDFPMQFIVEFFANHGLLQLRDRPQWRTISGGSKRYVERICSGLQHPVRLNTPVFNVQRDETQVEVMTAVGSERFDEVIFACHSDQALKILAAPTQLESSVLCEFPYSENSAILHTDRRLLPRQRASWASWNYRIPNGGESRPCVTYWMNHLQHLSCPEPVCVTLNADDAIAPEQVLRSMRYSHPVFTTRRSEAQRRHAELVRKNRTSYCGAYWGNGFHEDGVNSALRVCAAFGKSPAWAGSPAPLSLFNSQEVSV